jgi:hypothetical protein
VAATLNVAASPVVTVRDCGCEVTTAASKAVSVAALLVTWPMELLTITENVAPESVSTVAPVV